MPVFVSASAIASYIECDTKVFYRITKKIDQVQSREMIMGEIAHKVIEREWKNLDEALQLAVQLCGIRELDSMGVNSVLHFVRTFFDSFQGYVTPEDKIEYRFKTKLWDDVYLVGVFDRIANGNVFDWKTNANPPKRLENNVQFILYDLAYNKIFGTSPSGLYLASLKKGSLVKYKENTLYSKELIERIVPDYVETVRKGNYLKNGLFNGSCFRCPYKTDCLKEDTDELES